MAYNTRKNTEDSRRTWCDPQLVEHGTIAQLTQSFKVKVHGLGDDTFSVAVSTIS